VLRICLLLLFSIVRLVGSVFLHQLIVKREDQNSGRPFPTKSASWSRSSIFKISEAAIEAPATLKKASEGSLAVCSSIARATGLRYVQRDLSSTVLRLYPHWIYLSQLAILNGGTPGRPLFMTTVHSSRATDRESLKGNDALSGIGRR
jgi:hypothetical protein